MSTPSLLCVLFLALSLAGCGVGKLIDDTVDVVKAAADPSLDRMIVGIAATEAGGVIVQIAEGDAFRQGPPGASYRARPLAEGGALLDRLDEGAAEPYPIVEDAGMVAWALRGERIHVWSGAGRVYSVALDGSDLRPDPSDPSEPLQPR